MPSHVQSECSPTTARLDHCFSCLQPQFTADVIHLGDLGFLQRKIRLRVIRAGVNELFVEPLLIKIIANVVVVVDARLRFPQRMPMPSPLPTIATAD